MFMIPTSDQISKVNKEEELKRNIEETHKVASEWDNVVRVEVEEESSSSSLMSLYSIASDRKGSEVSSCQTPNLLEVQIPDKHEEVHSSLTTYKNPSERYSKYQEEEEDPFGYNIDEILEVITFNLSKKEVSQKRVRNEKQNDGTLKEIQEDEVLFERTDEDPITVATTSTTPSQATSHNVTMLNEKLFEAEADNH